MSVISVKYEDNYIPRTFSGKAYSYYTSIQNVNVGDIVIAPTAFGDKIARVSEIDIPEEKIKNIKNCLKTITKRIDEDRFIKYYEIKEVA